MNQFQYHVDIVVVMDATASMTPVLDAVKSAALGFHERLSASLEAKGKWVDQLRIRVIAFRDLAYNGSHSLEASPFFLLPQEESEFAEWIRAVRLVGNHTHTESALAGLSVGLHSPWTSLGDRRRHVVVLWTDEDAHLPEVESAHVPPLFADQVVGSFDDLTDLWHSSQTTSASSRRLVLFAPDKGVWPQVEESWDNVVWFPSQAGMGMADYDWSTVMDSIANSV